MPQKAVAIPFKLTGIQSFAGIQRVKKKTLNTEADQKMNSPWFLLQLKPNGYARAALNLERQAVTTFMPLHISQSAAGGKPRKVPLFPGYLFISFQPAIISFKTINSTYGVARLVTSGDTSFKGLPVSLIEGLKARCDETGVLQPVSDLKENEMVRITSGPFAEFVATVEKLQSKDRVRVIMELMGRETRAEVSTSNVRRVQAV